MKTHTESTLSERELILSALADWINQRPRLNFADYGEVKSYRAEMRAITRQRTDALILLKRISWRDGITADALKAGFRGRLTWDGKKLDYCTGQYWPTEYRAAACAVLASVLWHYAGENAMPVPAEIGAGQYRYDGMGAGHWLRRYFRREFGPGIQKRWLN